jgi:hypothetical protein
MVAVHLSYLYKRLNRFWHLLIKHHLVHWVWRPLIELSRIRQVHYPARTRRNYAGQRCEREHHRGRSLMLAQRASLSYSSPPEVGSGRLLPLDKQH